MPPFEIAPGVYFLDRAEGAGFQVVDFRKDYQISPPATVAGGTCIAEFDEVAPGEWWEIERMTIQNTSAGLTSATIYAGDYNYPQNFRDATASGNKDVADNNSPIRLSSTEKLYCVWTNCDLGATGTLAIQYKVLRRISGGN